MSTSLTTTQLDLLAAVQVQIVPSEGHQLDAVEADCPGSVAGYLEDRPELRDPILRTLQAIEATAGPDGFMALDEPAKIEILRRVETECPDAFKELVRQTYNAYYSNPAVLKRIGLPGPPQPDGYSSAPALNPDLLKSVRRRGRLWKDT